MTYPPTSPGYPVPQQPAGYGAPPAPQPAPGPSRLPAYLAGTVLGLGLLAYLASFGPQLSISTDMGPFGGAQLTASGLSFWTMAALLAALLAGVSLLPKVGSYAPVVAALAILGVLLVAAQIFNSPAQFSIGWGMWLGLTLTVLQAAAAVVALLFESGVLRAPAPRPRYEQYGQYGPPPGYFPGVQAQQPGYPTQYGGYPQGPGAPGPNPGSGDDSAHTPPTGFPGYQPSGDAQSLSRHAQAPTSVLPPVLPDPDQGSNPGSSQGPNQGRGSAPTSSPGSSTP